MEQYVGLDVSQKETAICVVDGEGKRVWQGACGSTPDAIAEIVRKSHRKRLKWQWKQVLWRCGIGTV